MAIATLVVCGKETLTVVEEDVKLVRFSIDDDVERFIKLDEYQGWFKFDAGQESDSGCNVDGSYALVDEKGDELVANTLISLGQNTIKIVPVGIPKEGKIFYF